MKEFILKGSSDRNFSIDYKKELNEQQLEIVLSSDGPSLVLAGAGSGKTRTITYRVAYLLENGIEPENILLLTFTNKAAKEMIERIESLLGFYPKGLWSGTFHSIANRILRRYGSAIGFEPNFSILDRNDSKDLISLCLKDTGIDRKSRRFPSSATLQEIISFQKNKHISINQALEIKNPKQLQNLSDIETVAVKYQATKKQQNAMDFDDMLLYFLTLLEQKPEIKDLLSRQFKYVLVDEFQDTNVIQAEIVKLLSSYHKNLLVVGDDAQSIYSFRAADIGNILNFPDKNNSTKVFHLTKNYRSTPEILDIANAVISKNKSQFKKELSALQRSGDKPCLIPAANTNQEAQYITEQILELNDECNLSDIAVLFRAAFHSQALEFELMKQDIPYDYRGGMRFFERSHIKDVVSHLRIIENVKDVMAWIRSLTIHAGIGLVTAGKIAEHCGKFKSVKDAIDSNPKLGKKAQFGWNSALGIWRDLLSVPKSPSTYVRALASNKEYLAYLENEFPNYRDRLDDLEQFAVFADGYNDMRTFLDDVSLTEEYGASRKRVGSQNEDRLVLSTIHQAKGLEWDAVFVMKLNEGSFPHNKVLSEDGGLEEERRLFYVAVTRAKRKLFMSYPLVAGFKHEDLQSPSLFVEEMPSELYNLVQLKRSASPVRFHREYDEEPTIVLDDLGEVINKQMPKSFLRNIDEL